MAVLIKAAFYGGLGLLETAIPGSWTDTVFRPIIAYRAGFISV